MPLTQGVPILVKAMSWTSNYLDGLEPGDIVTVSDVKVNDKAMFLVCVKQYIDWYGGIDFNSDFTKFRRLTICA